MPKQIKIDSEIIKKQLLNIVDKYGKLPENLRFDNDIFDLNKALGVNKTAKLLYDGKKDLRTIIDKTISAPFQEIRKFGESEEKSEIKCEKNWYNKLIYGDNLQALKYLLDNGYKEQIKLIYIDPPFATKSDFAKGETKAYRDKLEGAEFIEFIRERLILMKELLSKDGFIFVHLDDKKGHYIKVILDEIFLEANFRNDIVWTYNGKGLANTKTKFIPYNGNIYFYSKNPQTPINNRTGGISKSVMQRFGRYLNEYNQITFKSLKDNNETAELKKATKSFIKNNKREPIDEDIAVYYDKGTLLKNIWNDIGIIRENHKYNEYTGYPTQKPKKLLERILNACSLENDLILDAFIGSGTTCAVAEKLNRRWIGIDAGKLAIYTSQKRILDIQNHKPFIVINSGVYEIRDLDNQVNIDDNLYKDFACDLFQVDKNKGEKINGVDFSGKYGNNYVYIFSNKGKIIKQDLENLENKLNGKLKRVYIIISQNQDKLYTNYLKIKNTQFYIHKIPYSLIVQFVIENRDSSQIIKHLRNNVILKANKGNLKNKINETAPEIDRKALEKINKISQVKKKSDIEIKFSNIAGFDFVNTFEIEIEEDIEKSKTGLEIKINSVRIGEKNGIENLSMILVDKDYNQKSFKVSQTFFSEDDIEEDEKGNKIKINGFIKTKKITIGNDGLGKEIAVIYMDDFGNELIKQFTI